MISRGSDINSDLSARPGSSHRFILLCLWLECGLYLLDFFRLRLKFLSWDLLADFSFICNLYLSFKTQATWLGFLRQFLQGVFALWSRTRSIYICCHNWYAVYLCVFVLFFIFFAPPHNETCQSSMPSGQAIHFCGPQRRPASMGRKDFKLKLGCSFLSGSCKDEAAWGLCFFFLFSPLKRLKRFLIQKT